MAESYEGLKFSNWQNSIDHTISTGVEYESEVIFPWEHVGDIEDIIRCDMVDYRIKDKDEDSTNDVIEVNDEEDIIEDIIDKNSN